MSAPTTLRVEHLENPLGLADAVPRLSWWPPLGAREQQSYEVEINGTALGRIESPGSVLVPWPLPPLQSRQHGMAGLGTSTPTCDAP